MSYDMHGLWEKGNKWTGEFLNAHTNLTEISAALDLMWRNDIDPSKVVLGLAFYARAFTAANVSCKTPGCLLASGRRPGRCSHEISILLNSEIDDIVIEKGLQPVLYKDAAVKVVAWDGQWLAYDDAGTLNIKTYFARNLGIGGVMVWAISHDTAAAKYSKALAK
jgi:GH18 family chitinase